MSELGDVMEGERRESRWFEFDGMYIRPFDQVYQVCSINPSPISTVRPALFH